MNIDWKNKPDWADVWLETVKPKDQERKGGWHKSNGDDRWVDENGYTFHKENEGEVFRVHYPPQEQPSVDYEPNSGATTAYLYKQVAELRNEVMELKVERDILEEQAEMLAEKLVKLRGNNK